jgi:hypothetical protein
MGSVLPNCTDDYFFQIIGESITRCTDISLKKKQLIASLTEAKMIPQNDEKVRKAVKEIKEYMNRDQINMVHRIREVSGPENVDMVKQFVGLLGKGGKERSNSFVGLPQFLSFLNKGGGESKPTNSGSPRAAPRSSTLPRNAIDQTLFHIITVVKTKLKQPKIY